MEETRLTSRLTGRTSNRRHVLLRAGGLAAGAALLPSWCRSGSAQALEGQISVQFETRGGVVEEQVNAVIQSLAAQNPNATITVANAVAGNYTQQMTVSLMSGQAADVFAMSNIATGQLAGGGAVVPLNPFLEQWPDWEQVPQVVKDNLDFGGQTFGLPYSVDTHFLYYRKDIFQQVGLPVPWQPQTLDDVTDAARAIKQSSPDIIPLVLFAGANPGNSTAIRGFLPLLYHFGGSLKDAGGKWVIDSCAIRETLGYYELAYQTEALVPEDVMTSVGAADAMRVAFATGDAAIMFDGSWVWDDWAAAIPTIDDVIGYALLPAPEGGIPFTIGGFGATWFINARSANPQLAWAFVAAMMGKDVLAAINIDDPHIPPRLDAIADARFQDGGFLQAMVETLDAAVFSPPEPEYQALVGIIQNATGIIATGESSAVDAVQEYSGELTRVLGEENVVSEACK